MLIASFRYLLTSLLSLVFPVIGSRDLIKLRLIVAGEGEAGLLCRWLSVLSGRYLMSVFFVLKLAAVGVQCVDEWSQPGVVCPPGDICQRLETFLVVTASVEGSTDV